MTLILVSVARSVLQDMEFKIYSLAGCCIYSKNIRVTNVLDPAPAFELHRSRLLYFVDHKAWDSTYVDILSKAQKAKHYLQDFISFN